ncbi:MAG: Flp pilus assembly protein CpaB [Hyphomonadaceae bacterium]
MSPLRLIFLLLALLAAVGTFLLARSALSTPAVAAAPLVQVETEVQVPEVDVLVAVRDFRVGEVIMPQDLAWAPWPEETVNPAYYTLDQYPDAFSDISGQVVRIPMFSQEPILPQKIVDQGNTGVMAALVSPGKRAVSVEISAESAAGGFILPDDRVDVILTHEVELETANGVSDDIQSTIILENVRVLAIDQRIALVEGEGQTAIGQTATLELSPEDTGLIAYGERKGVLSLALRSLTDAALAGDVVTSRAGELKATSTGARVTIFRNGRVRESSAGAGE